jgi:hypothetical protein
MAAQPGQIALPGLVALVYRADWTRLRLSGTVHARHDVALRNRMSFVQATGEPLPGPFGRWLRSAQPGPDHEPDTAVMVTPAGTSVNVRTSSPARISIIGSINWPTEMPRAILYL